MDPALNIYLKAADMAYDIGEIHALTPDCAHHDTLLRQQRALKKSPFFMTQTENAYDL